jgi:hypothetical protein
LIRISSTFVSPRLHFYYLKLDFSRLTPWHIIQFYHLSPEYELHGLPELVKEAERRFGPQEDYGRMTVAEQVQRELGMIALYKE